MSKAWTSPTARISDQEVVSNSWLGPRILVSFFIIDASTALNLGFRSRLPLNHGNALYVRRAAAPVAGIRPRLAFPEFRFEPSRAGFLTIPPFLQRDPGDVVDRPEMKRVSQRRPTC